MAENKVKMNWSKAIIGVCTIALVVTLVLYAFNVQHTNIHYTLEYTITTDSLGVVNKDAKELADSVVAEIRKQEHLLEDKYEHAINQQTNTQDLLALGGVLMGIIVSLVGFFGYSTMQSIEEKARKTATDAAETAFKKKLEDLQNKAFKEYLEDKAKPDVDKKIEEALNKFEGEKTSTIDDLNNRLIRAELAVSELGRKQKKDATTAAPEVNPDPNPFEE